MMQRRAHHTVRIITIITDILVMNLAFVLAYLARYRWQWLREVEPQFFIPYTSYLGQQALLALLLIATFWQGHVWARRRGEFYIDEVSRIGYATAAGFTVMVAYTFFVRPVAVSRLMLFWAALFTVVILSLARLARRALLSLAYQRGIGVDHVLVVGAGEAGRGVIRTLLARTDLGFKAIGYLNDGMGESNLGSGRIPHLGRWQDLGRVLREKPYLHTVFIALPAERHEHILKLVRQCQKLGVNAQVVPDLFQLSLGRVELNNMGGIPVLGVRDTRLNSMDALVKRLVDLGLIIVLSPLACLLSAVIAMAIKLDSRGPVFYAQERVGQDGRPFTMIKFRSMVVNADQQKAALWHMNEVDGPIFKIRDDPRLTRVGRFIRRLSLDELPQFYNILLGHMSFVGPRPPLAEEVARYQPWHRQRLEIKGGLTGLWQVSGRSDLTFDEQCLLDIYYIENWSLALDLRIILQTLPYAMFRRGAY